MIVEAENLDPYSVVGAALRDAAAQVEDGRKRVRRDGDYFQRVEQAGAFVEGSIAGAIDALGDLRREFESALSERQAVSSRELEAIVLVDKVVFDILLDHPSSDDLPVDVKYVLAGLATRAISVGHECLALLRAGFPVGARARWRTLVELMTVSRVLALGNRHLFTRYKWHRVCLAHKDLKEAGLDPTGYEGEVAKLQRRFGRTYASTCGWAAPVTRRHLGKANPRMWDLEGLADVDHRKPWVLAANHAVHADSLGMLQMVDSDGLFHSGAREEGLSISYAHSILALSDVVDALLAIWVKFAPGSIAVPLRDLSWDLHLAASRYSVVAADAEGQTSSGELPFGRSAIGRALFEPAPDDGA